MVLSAGIYSDGLLWRLNRGNYRQFSITIVSAMALSVLVALILTPRCARRCSNPSPQGDHGEGKKGFFGWFNRLFDKSTHHYTDSVGNILRSTGRYLLALSHYRRRYGLSVRSSAKLFLAG
ncbi:acriflavin resistance protein B [Salmonella enterica subsp. enterica]|uniref:Acriflavin resistance protein B n=1 Tax=Salmonella enterica I TaxID=59201 RepID=A0A379WZL4_SALET|nr:acriflavin resistance protein B [Salmonella enterica subsp. enterica]